MIYMRQVVVKKGTVLTTDVPRPRITGKNVLVQVKYSCISAGTEMMSVSQSEKNLVKKAIEQPQKVKQAVEMVKTNGFISVLQKVEATGNSKPLGYSAAGIVIEVGDEIKDIKIGDRVAVAGAGLANHAEIVSVPRNLLMKMPDGLGMDEAATVALGGIAMQGVRRLNPTLGETIIVLGLGFLGQLAAQMLSACGCHVVGVDFSQDRVEMAKEYGCEYAFTSVTGSNEKIIKEITGDRGVDGVLIAAATNSDEVLNQCFNITRRKGRVILLGVVGCKFEREAMYQKELDFGISTSYGPGRYDSAYEENGIDYPFAYVRWTENRNMEEYLRLLCSKKVDISRMIESVSDVNDSTEAYEKLKAPGKKPLVSLLKYERELDEIVSDDEKIAKTGSSINKDGINVAIVGAGGFAKATHLPNLSRLKGKFNIYAVMSQTGLNAKNIAEQYNAEYSTTDYNRILEDDNVDLVIICTRHNLHAKLAISALEHGKSVLLEKPLALNFDELENIKSAAKKSNGVLMVGYNRRYSPMFKTIKKELSDRVSPIIMNYTMNAGYIPLDSWVHTEEGGGRIIGEACHIIDLCSYVVGSRVQQISCNSITGSDGISSRDNVVITMKYDDGSVANIIYTALGNPGSGKETCEIYCDKKTIKMHNYLSLEGYGTKFKNTQSKQQDKGHFAELEVLYDALKRGERFPISWEELEDVSRISIIAEEKCKNE